MTVAPGPLRLVTIGDSVSTNALRDLGTEFRAHHADEVGTIPYPQLVCADLAATWGRSVVSSNYASSRQTVFESANAVANMDVEDSVAVIVAHGSQEALIFPPRRLRRLQCFPARADSVWVSRRARSLDVLRRPIWRLLDYLLQRFPALVAPVLLKLGFRRKLSSWDYERLLRQLTRTLLERTSGPVVLLETSRTVTGYWLVDPLEMDRNDRAAHTLAALYPERVRVCQRPSGLDDRQQFLADGGHLTQTGHRTLAAALVRCLRDLQLDD